MRIAVGSGTYVLAVSGGVDSMVLLDLLARHAEQRNAVAQPSTLNSQPLRFVVAHFDHGIRPDSEEDRKLVQNNAKKHGLPFVFEVANLGSGASEAKAREARYEFLERVRQASGAKAIITAHHQDDLLETAIINLLRGSGRRGLTSLKSTDKLLRPLLGHSKERIKDYAAAHSIAWREDSTNTDTKYIRNYVRHKILSKFSDGQKAQLLILLEKLAEINQELDGHITGLLHVQPAMSQLDRLWFVKLPHDIAREVVRTWLGRHGANNITKKTIERVIVSIKTGKIGQQVDIDHKNIISIGRNTVTFQPRPLTRRVVDRSIKNPVAKHSVGTHRL